MKHQETLVKYHNLLVDKATNLIKETDLGEIHFNEVKPEIIFTEYDHHGEFHYKGTIISIDENGDITGEMENGEGFNSHLNDITTTQHIAMLLDIIENKEYYEKG